MIEEIKGLTSSEAEGLRKRFGKNSVDIKQQNALLRLFFSQYKNFMSLLLFVATIFAYIIGDKIDAFFIFLFLIFNGIFGFIQEYRAEKTIAKLKELTSPVALVIRDGEEQEIDAREIVPGDIVVLREGSKVPADGVIITDIPLEVDESILTGESLAKEKDISDEIYSGTFIARGRGYLKVQEIGLKTVLGKIAEELEETHKPSVPLSDNLSSMTKRIALVACVLSISLIPIGLMQGRDIREVILIAVSIAVAAIPEGLALVVTIALAVGAYQMAKRKTLVRKMASIEALGSTNVILSDKTGTITSNKMVVKTHWTPNENKFDLFLRASVLGNTASLALKEDGGTFEVVGDPTDGALLSFAQKHIKDVDEYRTEGKVIDEKPFDPETKIIEVTWEHKSKKHTFIRGAPETILKLIPENARETGELELRKLASEGLRVIGLAHKEDGEDLSLLGFVGLYDAPRSEAVRAIEESQEAGIRIVMVTGDNPVTAKAIAEEVGLIVEGELVLTHDEIDKMSDEELVEVLPRVRIFARMAPEDKLRLVRLYKKTGNVVAVTGDGVNDALALSEAHVGVAMGGKGTDVAREAADIVITDDNLYTIVKAIEEGRGIYDNIVKVIIFLLATNLTEFFLIFFSVLAGLPIPLNPTQILWVNLVSDGAPAMALATDIKRHNLLKKPPRDIAEQILNRRRTLNIALIAFTFSLLLMMVYYFSLSIDGFSRLLIFNLLVIGEMIIIFVVRGGIFPLNRFMILSVVLTLLLQILISTVPELRSLFRL